MLIYIVKGRNWKSTANLKSYINEKNDFQEIKNKYKLAPLAQMAERWSYEPQVVGSIPTWSKPMEIYSN